MSAVERLPASDSPEPESISPLSSAACELSRTTPEEKARMARRLCEEVDPAFLQRGEPEVSAVASVVAPPSTASPLARLEGEHPAVDFGITARSPTFDERVIAAFYERAAAPPPPAPPVASPPVDTRQAGPPKRHPLEDLKITMLEQPISAEDRAKFGRLPFKPPTAVNELARTKKVPEHNPKQGKTMGLGEDCFEKPVAPVPFVGADVGAGVVPFPRLSLEQYASLCAELALWPGRSPEILPRYHVMNEAARRALSEHWQAELALGSEAHAMFVKAVAAYAAWLRGQSA